MCEQEHVARLVSPRPNSITCSTKVSRTVSVISLETTHGTEPVGTHRVGKPRHEEVRRAVAVGRCLHHDLATTVAVVSDLDLRTATANSGWCSIDAIGVWTPPLTKLEPETLDPFVLQLRKGLDVDVRRYATWRAEAL